jgi:hypothetical protein
MGTLLSLWVTLTSWSRVLLEKLTGSQLVKKFPAFYGIRRFFTTFTRGRYVSLSLARSIQSMPPSHFLKICYCFIYSSEHLGLPSGLFPSGFPTKILYTPSLSPLRSTCPAQLIFLDLVPPKTFVVYSRSLSSSLCLLLHSPVTSSLLAPNIPLQLPILKQPQPTFLPQCEQSSFTLTQNRQNNSSYALIFIFLDSKLEDKRFCTKCLSEKKIHMTSYLSSHIDLFRPLSLQTHTFFTDKTGHRLKKTEGAFASPPCTPQITPMNLVTSICVYFKCKRLECVPIRNR